LEFAHLPSYLVRERPQKPDFSTRPAVLFPRAAGRHHPLHVDAGLPGADLDERGLTVFTPS
jgi:hypothetical protein